MNTQTQTVATNDLRHSVIAHDIDGNPIYIKISLNDECKNGHQDFSITGDIYEKGKPKTDSYYISGGCVHEEILKAKPELKIFVDLHLSDYKGIPMYAVANGRYHMTNMDKSRFCEYYRISPDQYDELAKSKGESEYTANLGKLGILSQWEDQANKAIGILEEMTAKKFVVDSKRTNLS